MTQTVGTTTFNGVFCDMLSFVAPIRHKKRIEAGFNMSKSYNEKGDLVQDYKSHKRERLEGSHCSSIGVRTLDIISGDGGTQWDSPLILAHRFLNLLDSEYLEFLENNSQADILANNALGFEKYEYRLIEITGNPTKFFQGHNLLGSNDIHGLAMAMCEEVCRRYDIEIDLADYQMWKEQRFYMKRLDITAMFHVGTEDDVALYLNALNQVASAATSQSKEQRYATSIYFGSKSNIEMKAYGKYNECLIKKGGVQRLPTTHPDYDDLIEFAKGKIRFEFGYGGAWFSHNDRFMFDLRDIDTMFKEQIKKIKFGGAAMNKNSFKQAEIKAIDTPAAALFYRWKEGKTGKSLQGNLSKATYYRHRKILLDLGFNLSKPCPPANKIKADNVVYLSPKVLAPMQVAAIPRGMRIFSYQPSEKLQAAMQGSLQLVG